MIPNTYPFNLINKIARDDSASLTTHIGGFLEQIKTLDQEEQDVLLLRYEQKLSIIKSAEAYDVSENRINTIEARAFRKMSSGPRYMNYATVPLREYNKVVKQKDKAIKKLKQSEQAVKAVEEHELSAESLIAIAKIIKPEILMQPIESLEMTTRTHNCLQRLDIKTIGDIINTPNETFDNMKNFGVVSRIELEEELREFIFKANSENDLIK